ncbi:hypothetical protein MSG28_009576 [Choristoneura fumiferana]|uniref:Uncharacterized protein n=1 Tax=Choristoneura fumiferana TaxID=7141 RepID=A0ACC0JBN1_CHOFU|nr:hypothetical protein MSG28_009576 [Choristoneura fumiferana]
MFKLYTVLLLVTKPLSACCDIPELGDPQPLTECSNPKLPGPCNDVQCVFEKSGFLTNKNTLNKEAYRAHLKKWSENHSGWREAVDKAIADCVDKELRQYLDYPCKAYDVFTCTGIAMLKVIFAQGPPPPPPNLPPNFPPKCLGPPPAVTKPHECCQIPPFFPDEDFAACGFQKLDEDSPERKRGPPDCSKQLCMLKKYNLLVDDESIDEEGIKKFLDDWSTKNEAFKPAVEVAKERCIGKSLFGPPQICEANKLVFCVSSTIFEQCPTWQETEGCTSLKQHMDECKAFFPK